MGKLERKCGPLTFCGKKGWERHPGEEEETKVSLENEKENQPIEKEQADFHSSDEEGDLDIGDEDNGIQKVYSCFESKHREFYLNYSDMKEAFINHVYTKDASQLVKSITIECNEIAGQIIQGNYDLLMLIGTAPEDIREYFRDKHCTRIKERVEDSIFRSTIPTKDLIISGEEDSRELYKIMAEKRRSAVYEELLDELPIEDMTNLTHDTTPVMIEEVYIKEESKNKANKISRETGRNRNRDGLHLFVLVHGFGANHVDMQEIKNHIAMVVPNSIFLCSASNEGKKTDSCIESMGENLSEEIHEFFEDEDDVGDQVTKMTFIGHSMGGIIIRCALPFLKRFKKMMHGFCTLSSPHLGYATCKNKLVKVGLWAMQAWKKTTSLQQLSMTDAKEIRDTFMYKISSFKGLKWFKHVVLFSSVQDGYVTFDSARIQIFKNTSTQNERKHGSAYIEMATNIDLPQTQITRVDVNFCMNSKSIDTYIGRKAHILFLNNTSFLTMFTNRYKDTLFDA